MQMARLGDIHVHYRDDGDPQGAAMVFANSLGTDLRLWDAMLPHLPPGLRLIRYDMRGHGLTDAPPAPYAMGALIADAERLMDHLGVTGAVFVGLSIGGMVAQGLAVKRPDLIAALVLSNTAARIATPQIWAERIAAVQAGGVEPLADAVMIRWFGSTFRATPQIALWRNMLVRTSPQGYAGCSAAISGTDLFSPTSGLRLPLLAIAGDEDGSTPPDLVRETALLVPGSRFHLMRGAGHLPCVEHPAAYAAALTEFLRAVGHAR